MIRGKITAEHEAIIELDVWGPQRRSLRVRAIVDTGFDGFLSLPAELVSQLSLPYACPADVILGDGSGAELALHLGAVEWDGSPRDVSVLRAKGSPLVGMGLLDGFDLHMRVVDGGEVTIHPVGP